MRKMVRVREQFTAEDCKICGMGNSYCVLTAEGKASVEVRMKEKTLRTKSGAEYIVSQKEYALVICQNLKSNADLETIEQVESFDAYFYFTMPNGEKEEHPIRDITPIRIDLDGDWIFSISDKDGDRLCYLNNKAMMRIL